MTKMLKHLTAQRLKEAQSSLQVLAKTSPKALSTHVLIETGINQPRTRAGRDPRLHSDRLWRNSVWTSRSLQLDRNSLFNPPLFLQYRLLALVAHIKNIWVCHLLFYIYLENISLLISFLRSASPVLACLTLSSHPSSWPCSPPLRFSRELRAMEGGEGGGNLSSACPSDRGGQTAERGIAFQRTISSFVFLAKFHCCLTE